MPSLKMARRRKEQEANTREMQRAQAQQQWQGLPECHAKEMATEIAHSSRSDTEDEDEEEDLLTSVRRWLGDQGEEGLSPDCLKDFNLKVRFQGYANIGLPDHLMCILHVICQDACSECELLQPNIKPATIAAHVGPALQRFAPILAALYENMVDPRAAADAFVQGVLNGVTSAQAPTMEVAECAAVGCFMAIRKLDLIEDEFLLIGCRRIEAQTAVMQKFVRFMEEACASDDDDDDDEGSDDDDGGVSTASTSAPAEAAREV